MEMTETKEKTTQMPVTVMMAETLVTKGQMVLTEQQVKILRTETMAVAASTDD